MPGRVTVSLVLAAALAVCGCSSSEGGTEAKPGSDDFTQGQASPSAPQPRQLAWGQPAEVLGANLRKLRVTPIGVLYHRGPYKDTEGPENGWFVAIAIKAEAVDGVESVAGGAGGGGFHWRGGGQTLWSGDGNAVATPWVGAVPELGDAPIEPGSPEVGIETFDVPSKAGGRLLYISPEDNSITSWVLPSSDQGVGLDKVRARIKLFS